MKPVAGFDSRPDNINRNGRPKKEWTWRSLLVEVAEEIEEGSNEPKKKLMAKKLVAKALEGDTTALREFGDRIDGRSAQSVDVTSDGERIEGITVEFVAAGNLQTET